MRRSFALATAMMVAVAPILAGCNAIFGVDQYVVAETGGGGAGGSPMTTSNTGGDPCSGACPAESCCDGKCADLTNDTAHCGACGTSCEQGSKCCNGQCTDITLDEENCGGCGISCPGTVCFGAECSTTCAAPSEDCNKNLALDGCESDLTSDVSNCGSCGIACPAGATCDGGVCSCPPGKVDCDNNLINGCEAATGEDPMNCGGCGQSCGPGQICFEGACVCAPGTGDCNQDLDDGCEASLTSMQHCGVCGTSCGPHQECLGGMCQCSAGFLDCTPAAGCESSAASPQTCGGCDVLCTGGDVCDGMLCASGCLSGQTDCSGSCANLMTSPLHCGACDSPVGPGQMCAGGVPTCLPETADCTPDPGCETPILENRMSCGGCGILCKPGAVCVQGSCVCAASSPNDCGTECRVCCGDTDCGDGQGCTIDTCSAAGDACSHMPCSDGTQCCSQTACAECCSDTDCAPNESCSGGICAEACPVGVALCNGQCVDTLTDPNNCNGCNIKCGSDGTCACSGGACSGGTVYFSEDFSDNFKGWTLGTEWAIGPTSAGSGQQAGNPDPAMDHSVTGDNGVAGAVLGGNYSTQPHQAYNLTSPVIDLSGAAGAVKLTFYRWLNAGVTSGTKKITHKVEISTGGAYSVLWQSSDPISDMEWMKQEIDVTAYKSATTKIRFSFNISGGNGSISTMSGMNIDDLTFSSGTCN